MYQRLSKLSPNRLDSALLGKIFERYKSFVSAYLEWMMEEEKSCKAPKPHAIVIEDDGPLIEVYNLALIQAGYFVTCFSNGLDAMEYLKTVSPRLILLDLQLPGASGDQILDSIDGLPGYEKTKVFLITSNPRLGRHLSEKVDLVLEKPVRFKMLYRLAEKYRYGQINPNFSTTDSGFFNSAIISS